MSGTGASNRTAWPFLNRTITLSGWVDFQDIERTRPLLETIFLSALLSPPRRHAAYKSGPGHIAQAQVVMSDLGVGAGAQAYDKTFTAAARFWSFDVPFANDVRDAADREAHVRRRFEYYKSTRAAMVALAGALLTELQVFSDMETRGPSEEASRLRRHTLTNREPNDTAKDIIKLRLLSLAVLGYIEKNYQAIAIWLGEPVQHVEEAKKMLEDKEGRFIYEQFEWQFY